MFRHLFPDAWSFHRKSCNLGGPPVTGAGTLGSPVPPADWKRYRGVPVVELDDAELPPVALAETLRRRVSCRRFDGSALRRDELSALLRSAFGVGDPYQLQGRAFFDRPFPSAGGCYPLELYLLVRDVERMAGGIYHYAPREHRLETLRGPLPWPAVRRLFLDQPYLDGAAAIVVLTAVVERTLGRYGNRGLRFIYMEAGHAAQNLNLAGEALELGTLDLGGFYDDPMSTLLGLHPEVEIPLYAVAVGRPATDDRHERRLFPA